jgi:hypothetical protein
MLAKVRPLPFRTEALTQSGLQLHERVARAYQAATHSLPSAPPELRKARSLSQAPSALERLAFQLIRMRSLGATIAELRAIPAMLEALLDDLASPAAHGRLIALLREGELRGHDAALAELESFANTGSAGQLHSLAAAKRAEAAIDVEIANEAEKEARELEGIRA